LLFVSIELHSGLNQPLVFTTQEIYQRLFAALWWFNVTFSAGHVRKNRIHYR